MGGARLRRAPHQGAHLQRRRGAPFGAPLVTRSFNQPAYGIRLSPSSMIRGVTMMIRSLRFSVT